MELFVEDEELEGFQNENGMVGVEHPERCYQLLDHNTHEAPKALYCCLGTIITLAA